MSVVNKSGAETAIELLDCVQTVRALVPKIKILLCEDSAADCLLLRREVTRSGLDHEIHQVQSEAELLDALKSSDYDIIISDYHVPGYSVEQAYLKARSINSGIPFIVMSGVAVEEDLQDLLHLGISDFVSKNNPVRLIPSICREIVNGQKSKEGNKADIALRGLEDRVFLHQSQEKLLHSIQESSFRISGTEAYLENVLKLIFNCDCVPFDNVGEAYVVDVQNGKLKFATRYGDVSDGQNFNARYNLSRGKQALGQLRLNLKSRAKLTEPMESFVPRLLATISEALHNKFAEQKLLHQATHHELTNLPNKRLLLSRSDELFISSPGKSGASQEVVMFVDIDNLKQTYDSLGSKISEALQVEVSQRLFELAKPNDFIAHIDSDLFCLVLSLNECATSKHKRGIDDLVAAVRDITKDTILIDGNHIFVTVSIGIAVREPGIEFEALLQRAELALHAARLDGRNKMQVYEPVLSEEANKRHQIEHDLRFAIERSEFELYFQPQVDPVTEQITSCEALIRWNHPERGLVSPMEFIPIAEDSGQIHAIGEWVLESACRQAKHWLDSGLNDLSVAVNISAAHFLQPGFINQVTLALGNSGLPSSNLELEITETVAMQINHMSQIVHTMKCLREIGVSLAIDDFGTGFSSLSYIQKFPIEKLKIDRDFVKDVGESDDGSLAKSIILLAKNLNLRTVIEGVETERQKKFFLQHECDLIQGYYYSKPLPANEFYKLVCELN